MMIKPVFLTKEKRAKLAEEQEKQEEARKKAKEEEEKRLLAVNSSNSNSNSNNNNFNSEKNNNNNNNNNNSNNEKNLAPPKKKKRILRAHDLLKTADWDEDEDTYGANDSLLYLDEGNEEDDDDGDDGYHHDNRSKNHKNHNGEQKVKEKEKEKEKEIEKEKHWNVKSLEEMTARDWRILKEDFGIMAHGGNIPNPIRAWKESKLPKSILDQIKKAGYERPTPIQMQCISLAFSGRDIIGLAETGSGKTAAFLLPMLCRIMNLPRITPAMSGDGPYGLVLAPARELVLQIYEEARKFADPLGISCFALIGGVPIQEQGASLRKGCEIIIATPGRLNDILQERLLVLNRCNHLVLDEADRMVSMGFEPQLVTILEHMQGISDQLRNEEMEAMDLQISSATAAAAASLAASLAAATPVIENNETRKKQAEHLMSKDRITAMFSATMPATVERIAKKYLRNPAIVAIGTIGATSRNVTQRVVWANNVQQKKEILLKLIEEGPKPPIIVFINSRANCDLVADLLRDNTKYRIATLHGGKAQSGREEAWDSFKNGKADILVATDLAGRGLDITGVSHVINFDMPEEIAKYTHRVGRTGRAGMKGLATSIMTNNDTGIMYFLRQALRENGDTVPSQLSQHPASRRPPESVGEYNVTSRTDLDRMYKNISSKQ